MRIFNNGGPSASQFSPRHLAQYLLRSIGEGSDQHHQSDDTLVDIGPNLNYCTYIESYSDIVQVAFGNVSIIASPATYVDTTVLAATNAVVDHINDLALDAFPGDPVVYLSKDEHIIDSVEYIHYDLHSLHSSSSYHILI